jgi:hypothetical protein
MPKGAIQFGQWQAGAVSFRSTAGSPSAACSSGAPFGLSPRLFSLTAAGS